MEERLRKTAKELAVFLSFLGSREGMDKLISDFNMQSTTSIISIEGNKARIEFRSDLDGKNKVSSK